MELKLKEGVDLSLLTTQYKVEAVTLELLEGEDLPLEHEIRLKIMISLVNYLTDGQIFKLLEDKKDADLYNAIINEIEPLYNEYMLTHDGYNNIIDKMVLDIKEHYVLLMQRNNSVVGFLTLLFQEMRNLSPEEINNFKKIVDDVRFGQNVQKVTERLEETKEKVKENNKPEEINQKLEQLIESYQAKNN